jgi:putative ABC transport system permease protein
MISNYFKYAFRNLVKQRGRTLINLFGLSFSIAIVIIIYLFVSGELSYNKFHENGKRIYRMYSSVDAIDRGTIYSPYQPRNMAAALEENIPGIQATCRFKVTSAFIGPDEDLFQQYVGFVDSTFFDLFTYEIIAGDRETPLHSLKSVVLTETVARKIFQDSLVHLDELIGKTIKFPERPPFNIYTVTAIIADPPLHTSFYWDVLVPYVHAGSYPRSNDFGGDTYVYVMLDENNHVENLETQAQSLIEDFHGEDLREYVQMGFLKEGEHNFAYHFMPYRDLYLETEEISGSYEERGNKTSLYILSSIAGLILLIACFNYVMISIGTALNRVGDFGMMNVVGARRWQILAQFVVESFLLTLVSLFLGIILAEQLLPLFNRLANDDLIFSLYSQRNFQRKYHS